MKYIGWREEHQRKGQGEAHRILRSMDTTRLTTHRTWQKKDNVTKGRWAWMRWNRKRQSHFTHCLKLCWCSSHPSKASAHRISSLIPFRRPIPISLSVNLPAFYFISWLVCNNCDFVPNIWLVHPVTQRSSSVSIVMYLWKESLFKGQIQSYSQEELNFVV